MAEVTGMTPDRISQEITTEIDKLKILRGTGSPVGKVSAPVGAVYIDTAATYGAIRWIKTSPLPTSGWQVEYGDTGWRDVTELLTAGWTADQVLLRRQNNTVILSTLGLSSNNPTSGYFIKLPTSFHTPRTFVTITTPGRPQTAFWNASMALTFQNYTNLEVNTYAHAQSTWEVEANRGWPTSLPGTPF